MDVNPFQPWVALIGAVVGFSLGEGSRLFRGWWNVRKNRNVIEAELQSILCQISDKLDILKQELEHLKSKRVMPMLGVRSVMIGYQSIVQDLYPNLSVLERNCLHVIYERLRVADEFMERFESDISTAIREKVIEDPYNVFAGKIEDLIDSYQTVKDITTSYLVGTPVDVFRVNG